MKKKKIRRLEVILHIITILILLLKAFDLLKKHAFIPSMVIMAAAAATLLILLFNKQISINNKKAVIICFYIETPALLLIAYMLHIEGKELLPFIFLIAGFIYPVAGFIASKKFKQIKNLRQ